MPDSQTPSKPAHADQRLPLIAGPMIWYLLSGLSILLALYVLLLADVPTDARRYGIAVFIGLWAPMFGIMGIRAEVMELGEDLKRK
jgi:hypothetical protein